MSSIEDRHGNEISFGYPTGAAHDIDITDTQGRHVYGDYNANGDITDIFEDNIKSDHSVVRAWTYTYKTGTRLLESVTDPAGSTTTYGYDGSDQLTTITDPNGTVITITYDDQLRVHTITRPGVDDPLHPDNAVTTYTYSEDPDTDLCGSHDDGETTITDPNGHDSHYCWDSRGRVTHTQDADGNKRGADYDDDDDLTSFTDLDGTGDPANFSYDFGSDGSNRILGGTLGGGEQFSVKYCDKSGEPSCGSYPQATYEPTSVQSPTGSTTYMGYNDSGDLERVGNSRTDSDPPNAQADRMQLHYNSDGTLDWAEDGRNNTTSYQYDDDGNLKEIDPPGSTIKPTKFTVDGDSRIDTVADGERENASETQIDKVYYDGVDRVTRLDYHDGSRFEFVYDANGNVTSRKDFAAPLTTTTPLHETDYTYDLRNQTTSESYDPGTAFNTYSYDLAGNLLTLEDSGGAVTYTYDSINRVTSITEPSTAEITIVHNDDDRETTITYPGGIQEITKIRKSGNVDFIHIKDGSTVLKSLQYAYHENPSGCGNQGTSTHPSSLVQSVTIDDDRTCYTYDALDRLSDANTTNSGDPVDHWHYTYDGASNRIEKAYTHGTGSTAYTSYAYGVSNEALLAQSRRHLRPQLRRPRHAAERCHRLRLRPLRQRDQRIRRPQRELRHRGSPERAQQQRPRIPQHHQQRADRLGR